MNKNILIAVLIVIIGVFAFLAFKPKGATTVSPITTVPEQQPTTTPQQTTPPAATSKTYSNTQYGFSFQYPNTWKVTEDKSKKEVRIDTNDIAIYGQGYVPYPSWSITFKATDKSFFNPPIGTKYGLIGYDESRSALTDGDRCLSSGKLFGNNPPDANNTSSIQSITYGGSLMSDPAYSDSAILTTNGEIIIVHKEQGAPYTPEIGDQLSAIASSFKLLNGNTVFVPTCAKQ